MRSNSQRITTKLIFYLLLGLFLISQGEAISQTTFTESAAIYGVNLNQNKDEGHALSDFDNDGDLDVLVLENNGAKSFLMQNTGGVFTNVQTTLAPGMLSDPAERQAAWSDLNNDGLPNFYNIFSWKQQFRTSHPNISSKCIRHFWRWNWWYCPYNGC